ncbi:MAG: hypothetical protein QMD96_06660 [Anaerosomatales bacterium]|nr:hypothetical protein [Anaerosomatales bacterium]
MARADGVRPRGRRTLLLALAVVALGAGALFVARVLSQATGARGMLADASGLLSQAEPTVLAVDQAVRSEVTTAAADAALAALEKLEPSIETLNEAKSVVARARQRLAERDRPLADALDEAIAARLEMLERARPVLEADVAVAQALVPAVEAWTLVGQAEKMADEAVASFNKHTKDGVQRSTKLTTDADALLARARSNLETVTAGFPEADMGPFISYIDAKRALLAESRKIDATWLSGKVADANAMLGAYNAREKQVAEQAKRLPGTPASVLAEAYKRAVEADVTAYFEARERARSADAKIRSLQGG